MERVELNDGSFISIAGLRGQYSQDIYQSELFYTLCESFVRNRLVEDELKAKVMVNFYALKSVRARDACALLYFLKNCQHQIAKIFVFDDVARLLSEHYPLLRSVEIVGVYSGCYVPAKYLLSCFSKVLAHRLFRLFTAPLVPSGRLVRGWVEVTEAMYKSRLRDSSLKIYPFAFGVVRQLRFLYRCKAAKYEVSLAGLPYSLFDFLKALLSLKRRDEALVLLELNAYASYSEELISGGVREVYTSDEFEIAGVVLYGALRQAGVKVINTAHGVGFYCPYVNYSEFFGFTRHQAEFYTRRCPDLNALTRSDSNSALCAVEAAGSEELPPAIVLIDQNFEDFGCAAEADALIRTKSLLIKYSEERKVHFFVKVHPNSRISSAAWKMGKTVTDWVVVQDYQPVFVTINSTALFDVRNCGPVLVYGGEGFLPEIYFGSDVTKYTLKSLFSQLDKLIQVQSRVKDEQV